MAMARLTTLESFFQDCRYTLRSLRRSRAFSIATVLTLGIGIGVLTGFFAVVNAVLLTPLAPHGDAVVRVWKLDPQRSIDRFPLTYPDLALWRERVQSFQALAAISHSDIGTVGLVSGRESLAAALSPVSADFFRVLHGGPPLIGRWFAATDEGATTVLAAVASERFWQRVSGGDPAFIGRRLQWPARSKTLVIIGVAPASLNYPAGTDLWVPIDGFFGADPNLNLDLHGRRFANFHFLGRLRPEATEETARAELQVVSAAIDAQFPGESRPMAVALEPILSASLGPLAPLTVFLFGTSLLVFLAAGGNVAALLIMRASSRARELAVRSALGASWQRIGRQTLLESGLLALAGMVLAVPVAQLSIVLVRSLGRAQIPRLESAVLDTTVFLFCALAAFAWTISFGAVPLWYQRHVAAVPSLQPMANRFTKPRLTLRTMVIAQVAAAVIIATTAGLLTRSFLALRGIDRGFDASRLATVGLVLPEQQYPSPAARIAFYERVLPALEALPGVVNATTAQLEPGTGQSGLSARMLFEGQLPDEGATNPYGTWEPVLPSYFDTLGVRIVAGRGLTESDDQAALPVAVVSESVARRYWPGQNPIGRRVQFTAKTPWATVVGVAADARYRELTRDWLTVYFPAKQFFFFSPAVIVVRTTTSPETMLTSLARVVQDAEPAAAVHAVETMEQLTGRETARQRAAVIIAAVFAGLAIFVVMIGVYAVSSYEVATRTRDLAVRAAIGAGPGRLLSGALQPSLVFGAVGTVVGAGIAALVTRYLGAILFEVTPLDATSFAVAGLGILAVVFAASLGPARRAMRSNPATLLQAE